MNRQSFLIGVLAGLCAVLCMNATFSEYLWIEDPNTVLHGKEIFPNTPNIHPTFGDVNVDSVTAEMEVSGQWYELQTIDTDTRNARIQESLNTGRTFLYRIELPDEISSIHLLINGIEYQVEVASATATIERTTDPLRVVFDGVEYALQSVEFDT